MQAYSNLQRGRWLRQIAPAAIALLLLAIVLIAFLLLPAAATAADLATVVSAHATAPAPLDFHATSATEQLVAC